MEKFVARKEDLFKKKLQSQSFSSLRKFFTFLKENGVETLEESFFDEDKTELATKFLEEAESWKLTKTHTRKISRMARDFVKYCAEEHALISHDKVRKENANKMVQVLSDYLMNKTQVPTPHSTFKLFSFFSFYAKE